MTTTYYTIEESHKIQSSKHDFVLVRWNKNQSNILAYIAHSQEVDYHVVNVQQKDSQSPRKLAGFNSNFSASRILNCSIKQVKMLR